MSWQYEPPPHKVPAAVAQPIPQDVSQQAGFASHTAKQQPWSTQPAELCEAQQFPALGHSLQNAVEQSVPWPRNSPPMTARQASRLIPSWHVPSSLQQAPRVQSANRQLEPPPPQWPPWLAQLDAKVTTQLASGRQQSPLPVQWFPQRVLASSAQIGPHVLWQQEGCALHTVSQQEFDSQPGDPLLTQQPPLPGHPRNGHVPFSHREPSP